MTKRVIVFIDGMNVYKGAREAFFPPNAPHLCGQFDPVKLGYLLERNRPSWASPDEARKFIGIRVYQGTPSAKHDPKGYAADRRHRAAWEKKGVTVVARPIRYSPSLPPREKGIDVALAIDFVAMAVEREYDVGVLFSTDTDLVPALEYVHRRGVEVETVTWLASADRSLKIAGARVWNHRLRQAEFDRVRDDTDYRPPAK